VQFGDGGAFKRRGLVAGSEVTGGVTTKGILMDAQWNRLLRGVEPVRGGAYGRK
jgi:hypothetical protein